MYFTYVIKSKKDNNWYTGYTKDLRNRIKEHNEGNVFSTKTRRPFELIYYEACLNEKDAIAREKYLKSGMGKRYLKNRLKVFLSLTGFTILEILIVILALTIVVGVVNNVYIVGLDLWSEGISRSSIRTDLSQALELVSKNLRRATSIDAITASSITFTADLGGGSSSYRVYLYNASDSEPNPPYSQDNYDLRWAQGTTTYGSGANLATDIAQPINTPFTQNGNVITLDLTATRGEETVRLRSNVRPRNL